MKIGKELVTGSAALAVLKVIAEGETYGYEIVQKLAARSENVFRLSEGTLYPILHAMVKEKYIVTFEKEGASRRVRKYYRITAIGEAHLALLISEWRLFSSAVEGVLAGESK